MGLRTLKFVPASLSGGYGVITELAAEAVEIATSVRG